MAASVSGTPVGRSVALRSGLATDVRAVAAVVAAGLVLGVTVNGVGSRLAMLLLARLNPAATGRLSDDGFRMGQFDLGATLSLLSFTTAVGVLGGLVYLAVRPLRFGPRWFVLAAMAVGPAVVVGNLLVHVDGVDFTILQRRGWPSPCSSCCRACSASRWRCSPSGCSLRTDGSPPPACATWCR